jgi:hypothetical protein
MDWQVVCADVLDWAAEYDGLPFHACLCDPSYALSRKKPIVLEAIASLPSKPTNAQVIAAYHALQQWGDTGFMGREWDTDVAFNPETWAALAQHLYPGAWIMAFASSRGYHRLAVAMEDSGLIIQPSLFIWLNAQAFPKSTRITSRADGNSPFCQCDDSQRQFPGHDFQDSVPDGMSKGASSQVDCPASRHSDDGQPHRERGSAQGVEPLQGDAQEHSHSCEPLLDTQEGSEPLHSPCQAQCSDHQPTNISHDSPKSSGDASQSLLGHEDETYHECDSQQPNTLLNKTAGDSSLVGEDGDRLVSRKSHTCNSGDGLPSSCESLDSPFLGNSVHDTTEQGICQICGKPKESVWAGHRYGGQILKNCAEPVICTQKPWAGKRLDCIVETGAGSLWVDGARIETDDNTARKRNLGIQGGNYASNAGYKTDGVLAGGHPQGRWPSNFTLECACSAIEWCECDDHGAQS